MGEEERVYGFTLNGRKLVARLERPLASEVLEIGVGSGVLDGSAGDYQLAGAKGHRVYQPNDAVELGADDHLVAVERVTMRIGHPITLNGVEVASPERVVRAADIAALAQEWDVVPRVPRRYRVRARGSDRAYALDDVIDLAAEREFVIVAGA